jgi:predicted GNAT family acetyltransferase
VKDCIAARVNTCIRYRDPATGTEELIAWALARTDFAVSMVKVSENHRRKGLGTRVVIRQIQKVLDLRPIPGCGLPDSERPIAVCYIDRDNEASKQMHRQMGFAQHPLWHRWIRC